MKKPTPFGKYYLLERINVGGMAEVFRAKAFGVEGFERLVAVKRILPNIAEDKEFIRMFIEEAKLAVQLNHANIAQIFDLGVVDGAYYIALEHVHGRDLRGMFDRCRQLGEPMPVSQACFVVMKLCEGLDYAHNKRDQAGREVHLVHRDVSPQNVLVSFEGEVKIIDFGIAKAAGKGSKTQAGILKGKFGYMSPEQVRGIPIDRRSDVFSCGIVLYELLTGERLFVGESDFSTLEKVRNVEILPPTTYNRRIPDELERIVLKALAKDPEERYQNAIDLHDELQAFVYTAGEFYSRKDLAGWMKKTFGREIEEETAKLESYRQLKAPADAPVAAPAMARTPTGSKPPVVPSAARRSTQGMAAVGNTKPPPPPTRMSQQMQAVSPSQQAITAPTGKLGRRQVESGELAWDDDELETQIYDNPEDDPRNQPKPGHQEIPRAAARQSGKQASIPLAAPSPTPAPELAASPAATLTGTGPDLSSLVSTAKGWESAAGANGSAASHGPSNGSTLPPPFANGSGKGPTPAAPLSPYAAPIPSIPQSRETAAPVRLVSTPNEPVFDPMASFGAGMLRKGAKQPKSKSVVYVAVGGAAVAVIAVIVVITMTGGEKTNKPVANPGSDVAVVAGDQNTGFDLYVVPGGVTTWRLDGESRTDKLPSRIRGISPGQHQVSIDAPPGFMSQNQPISVESGKSPKVEIALKPIEGISGDFESTPPGAKVSLIIDGNRQLLGASPQKAPLDPRKTYQVLFEKDGYVSINKPIVFTGSLDEKVVVSLEKAGAATVADAGSGAGSAMAATHPVTNPVTNPVTHPAGGGNTTAVTHPAGGGNTTAVTHPAGGGDKVATNPLPGEKTGGEKTGGEKTGGEKTGGEKTGGEKTGGEKTGGGDKVATGGGGEGTLLLGSKPPCEIFIDGSSTGQHTPAKDIKLPAGKHKITLVNNEFSLKETFTVEIKADAPNKVIKDFSAKINPTP